MSGTNGHSFKIEQRGGVFHVVGELDLATAPELEGRVRATGETIVCLDLRAMSFIDSSGVHALVQAARSLGDDGCMILHEPKPQAARLFELLGLTSLWGNVHVLDGHVMEPFPGPQNG